MKDLNLQKNSLTPNSTHSMRDQSIIFQNYLHIRVIKISLCCRTLNSITTEAKAWTDVKWENQQSPNSTTIMSKRELFKGTQKHVCWTITSKESITRMMKYEPIVNSFSCLIWKQRSKIYIPSLKTIRIVTCQTKESIQISIIMISNQFS
jgi:hypothetical protein